MNIKTSLARYSRDAGALEALSRDKDWRVRSWVAMNRNTPPYILEILSRDENRDVRYWVARNRNTPPHTLETLSRDERWGVQYCAQVTLRNKDKV